MAGHRNPGSLSQPRKVSLHGVYDEVGHMHTTLMILIGLWGIRLPISIWCASLRGVILNVGHFMNMLDITESIADSSSNGSHSVFMFVLFPFFGSLNRRPVNFWLGIVLGGKISH